MASTIVAGNITNGGTAISSDSTGILDIKTGTGSGTTALTIDASQNVTAANNLNASSFTSASTFGYKNKIINGGMVIDQRNAGASGTALTYTVDRFGYTASQASKATWQQKNGIDSTASNYEAGSSPTGFSNSLKLTSSSAYSVISSDFFGVLQSIEGYNIADLNWGATAAAAGFTASSVTLSFWVKSSLTGTFSGVLRNYDSTRSYPYTYTISAANTWEKKSITIPGETTGTWLTNTGAGINLFFNLGTGTTYSGPANAWATANYTAATGTVSLVGTSGATWYITGVQLEKGSTATSFDYRDYGRELIMCQRYFQTYSNNVFSLPAAYGGFYFAVVMRIAPTSTFVQTAGTAVTLTAVSTSNGFVTGSATTSYNFTVSAEF